MGLRQLQQLSSSTDHSQSAAPGALASDCSGLGRRTYALWLSGANDDMKRSLRLDTRSPLSEVSRVVERQ